MCEDQALCFPYACHSCCCYCCCRTNASYASGSLQSQVVAASKSCATLHELLLIINRLVFGAVQAQIVAMFADHELYYPDARHDALVYVSQDWVASYCRVSTTLAQQVLRGLL
jgi:hypothetical protein